MYRSVVVVAAILIALLLILAAPTAHADDPPGAKLYSTYCAACHGAGGKGGFATQLGSEAYLKARDDDAIARITGEGVPTKGMPAWSKSKGGALGDAQIADIVVYLRSLAPTTTVPAPAANSQTAAAVNPILLQTNLVMTQAAGAAGEMVVSAMLQDYTGAPVAGTTIAFSRVTSFGVVDLGSAKTGANGVATIVLPTIPENAREVSVSFKGDKSYGASAARIALEPRVDVTSASFDARAVRVSVEENFLPPEGNLITPYPPLLPAVLLALVVGCVWATYGYVLYQVYGIFKHGIRGVRENILQSREE